LCKAPIVGTSTRRFAFGFACAWAIVVMIRIFIMPSEVEESPDFSSPNQL